MADIILSTYNALPPLSIKGYEVARSIQLVEIEHANEILGSSFACDNKKQIEAFRRYGIFDLPKNINYPGDMFHNTKITPEQWFFNKIDALYAREKLLGDRMITTTAGNAPGHEWEANYDARQLKRLASRDFEVDPELSSKRRYSCVTFNDEEGLGIGYVHFDKKGYPVERYNMAVGGKPLIHRGSAVGLAEFLETSISDPRHLIGFPEVDLGEGHHMPLGLRTIGAMIQDGRSKQIVDRMLNGETIELDMKAEKGSWGKVEVTDKQILDKLSVYGYTDKEYSFNDNKLSIRYKMKSYRHTFWAISGNRLFIGIIMNNMPMNDGTIDPVLYSRILKPSGISIPELQQYLVNELHADEAVMLGSGKDCRIMIKDGDKITVIADNDVSRERASITSGLLSVII